ncbi:MAG: hypothetical protein JNJ50_28925 [Acidobacteria bacterium]|nr:hypothetical protein [Acidobacteriota bacterium]
MNETGGETIVQPVEAAPLLISLFYLSVRVIFGLSENPACDRRRLSVGRALSHPNETDQNRKTLQPIAIFFSPPEAPQDVMLSTS